MLSVYEFYFDDCITWIIYETRNILCTGDVIKIQSIGHLVKIIGIKVWLNLHFNCNDEIDYFLRY